VLDFGADPTGSTDSTDAFKAAILAAKGADNTGIGRTVFSIYVPSCPSGFYKITDTLVLDGVQGLIIYGDGAYTSRDNYPSTTNTATIRWFGATSKPIFQLQGQTSTLSNPNFNVSIRDLTISGYVTDLDSSAAIPSGIALSGIHIGNVDGVSTAVLNRSVSLTNVVIANCRFGVWSGSPSSQNTDNAPVTISNCRINSCTQAGLWLGTGNAIFSVNDCAVSENGWGTYTSDNYATTAAGNTVLVSGACDIYSYVSSGSGTSKPITGDVVQISGRLSITNAWSDTHGIFFNQLGVSLAGSACQVGAISGIRHYEGGMTIGTTPTSMSIIAPGTCISSCTVYGNIEVVSGLSGKPIFSGINFIRSGAGFTGTGVTVQRSLLDLAHSSGNYPQIAFGGRDSGVSLEAVGYKVPSILHLGGTQTGAMSILQALGPLATSSGLTIGFNSLDGSLELYSNCYMASAAYDFKAHTVGIGYRISFGAGSGPLTIFGYLFTDTTTAIPYSSFVTMTEIKIGGGSYGNECVFKPPQAASNPTYSSGDFWKGGIYFNTTTNKIVVNTGGSTWETVTSI
jgi:hypothetical protein